MLEGVYNESKGEIILRVLLLVIGLCVYLDEYGLVGKIDFYKLVLFTDY